MDRLDRGADPEGPHPVETEQSSRCDRQERAEPFAAADRGVAHRFEEDVPAIVSRNKKLTEKLVDFALNALCLGLELETRPVDRLNRHRTA